jgi:hypothetical protein
MVQSLFFLKIHQNNFFYFLKIIFDISQTCQKKKDEKADQLVNSASQTA